MMMMMMMMDIKKTKNEKRTGNCLPEHFLLMLQMFP